MRPVRGQMLRLAGADWPWRGSVRWRHNYCVRRGAGGLLVGATVEEAGFQDHPTVDGITGLVDFARTLFPPLAPAPVVSIWAGLRPGSPDGRPLLGRIGETPLYAACGYRVLERVDVPTSKGITVPCARMTKDLAMSARSA